MTPAVTFTVLFEDDDVLAVAKPAGMTVVPARDEPPGDALRQRLESERGESLWVVHRLDRDTSGVLVFARSAEAHRELSVAFEHRRVSKSYVAWTRGAPAEDVSTVSIALHTARKGKMRPALKAEEGALAAVTALRVKHRWTTKLGVVARIEAEPHTGRQHQIRVHLRFVEAPLLVDPLYGGCALLEPGALGEGSPSAPRQTLHAASLTFPHPRTREPVTVTAPLPPDLAALDAWLEALKPGA